MRFVILRPEYFFQTSYILHYNLIESQFTNLSVKNRGCKSISQYSDKRQTRSINECRSPKNAETIYTKFTVRYMTKIGFIKDPKPYKLKFISVN